MNILQSTRSRACLKLTACLLAIFVILTPIAPVFAAKVTTPPIVVAPAPTPAPSKPAPPKPTPPVSPAPSPAPVPPVENPVIPPGKPIDTGAQANSLSSSLSQGTAGSGGTSGDQKTLQPKTDNSSGALVFDYPIIVPPGRSNLQRDLKLVYNSQNNETDSIFGYGWSANIPYITRLNKKGTDQLYSQDYFYSSLGGELVNTGAGTYAPKIENGDFLAYSLSSNVWTVKDKSGTIYKFGTNAAERQDSGANIYKWMLQEVRDTNNNYIKYTYFKDAGQIYPATIIYIGNGTTDGIFEIDFNREPRGEIGQNYKPAFFVASNYRINEIQVKVNGIWTKKYALTYTTGDNSTRVMLNTITESSQDDSSNVTRLPAADFDYQATLPGVSGWTHTYFGIPANLSESIIADVNGDGLPDILHSYRDSSGRETKDTFINNGYGGWTINSDYAPPVTFFQWAWGSSNPDETGVRAADVNGDGLIDLLQSNNLNYATGGATTWLNNGHGWTVSSIWASPLMFAHYSGSPGNPYDYQAFLTDLNGDGLPDLLHASSGWTQTYINNGAGWTLNSSLNSPIDLSVGAQVVDINSDGLADIMQSYTDYRGSHVGTYINTGNSWTSNSNWNSPLNFYASGYVPADTGVRIADINGDGLPDLLSAQEGRGATAPINYINNGNGWTIGSSGSNSPLPFAYSINNSDTGTRLEDINGDGSVDIIRSWGDTYLNSNKKADYATKISYPQGGNTTITYKATPQYKSGSALLNPSLPFALYTSDSTTTDDGSGHTATITYTYAGGKYFYNNVLDRKFSGFNKIVKTDSLGNKATTFYHQGDTSDSTHGEFNDDEWKIGMAYRIEATNSSGNLYSKTINKWDDFDLSSGRKFVKLVQTVESTFDGDSTHKDKATTFSYNNSNGNVAQKIEYGEVSGNDIGTFTDSGTDDFTTNISYATNGANLVGFPSQQTVTNHNSAKVKESKFYYDSLSLGAVTKGNQTKEEDWKSGTEYISTQKTYNSYGLVTSTMDPKGKTTSFGYDSFNLYPASVTNALNQTTNLTYDYSSGQITQKTDPNGRVFQNVYDGLDRLIEEKQPDILNPSSLILKSTYTYTDTPGALSVHKTDNLDSSTARETYQYFDGLGRLIQQRVEAEGSNYEVSDKVYNNRGLLDKESLPYFASGSTRSAPTVASGLYTTYTYDPMGRVVTTINNLGTTSNTYNDWRLTVIDANGKTKDLYKDAYGNLVQVDEHNGANTYSTYYTYDSLGNLTKITDALSNVRNFTYDGLGHRLTAQDLHDPADTTFGTYVYTYDDAGNLTEKVDPNGNTVDYTYDDLNRQLTEDYAGLAGTEVTYTYDSGTDGIGHLTGITTPALAQTNTYNALGGLKSESKVINLITYLTTYDYDRQGNQVLITNPDSSVVKYIYNQAGLLNQTQRKESTDSGITDVISNFDYSPTEQPTSIVYANGASTTNTYDATKLYRLISKVTTIAGSSHAQDLTYTYDPVGNITQIVDASATDTFKTANYGYDDLYRLTSATITGVASGQSTFAQTYTYNAIGNILATTETIGTDPTATYTYAYVGNITAGNYANPHAVTSISVGTNITGYTYDSNGNELTKGTDLINTWDYNNRLIQVVAGSNTDVYTYDPSGQRLTTVNTSHTDTVTPPPDPGTFIANQIVANVTTSTIPDITLVGGNDGGVAASATITIPAHLHANVADHSITIDGITIDLGISALTASQVAAAIAANPFTGKDYTVINPSGADLTFTKNTGGTAGNGALPLQDTSFGATAQVVTFTPALVSAGETFRATINGANYDYIAVTGDTVATVVAALAPLMDADPAVGCTEDISKITCTASIAGTAFTFDATVTGLPPSGGGTTYTTVTTAYPSKFYNTDGTTPTKHSFANGVEIATITGTGGLAVVRFIHTDHLTGSNVITNSTGTVDETEDYYPYGGVRFDQKTDSFSEQRKYAGSEFDTDTGLNYMNARYYDSVTGRFASEDPVFLAIGDNGQIKQLTSQELKQLLSDPQNLNAYTYGSNNPLVFRDPTGQFSINIFGFLPQSNQVSIGNSAQYLYNTNTAWRASMDHPVAAGAAIGIGSGAAAYGAAAGLTALSVNYLGGIGTACLAWCGDKIAQMTDQASNAVQLTELPIRPTAVPKLENLTQQFGLSKDEILSKASQSAQRYLDNKTGNINIWQSKPDGANGFIRVTTNPELNAIISAGQNSASQVIKGIANGRFTSLK